MGHRVPPPPRDTGVLRASFVPRIVGGIPPARQIVEPDDGAVLKEAARLLGPERFDDTFEAWLGYEPGGLTLREYAEGCARATLAERLNPPDVPTVVLERFAAVWRKARPAGADPPPPLPQRPPSSAVLTARGIHLATGIACVGSLLVAEIDGHVPTLFWAVASLPFGAWALWTLFPPNR